MKRITLRAKVAQILIVTFMLVMLTVVSSFYGYSYVMESLAVTRIGEELKQSSSAQADVLLPSFLLPEQKNGAALLLDRIKAEEGLASIAILAPDSSVPEDFSSCSFDSLQSTCLDASGQRTAVVFPIRESRRIFGYLFKVKQNDVRMAGGDWVILLEYTGATLIVSFLVLFGLLARLMSKDIPRAIDDLVMWIESDLHGTPSSSPPNLKFKELCDLRERIGEILERYDRARDQAVVGQLTSGIMHDIKTPMASIVAAAALAGEQPVDTPKRLARLENSLMVCQARLPVVGSIIESTLDGNREIHVERRQQDLHETIRAALSMSSELIRNRKIKIELQAERAPLVVMHDPIQLTRVITNLVRNAVEANAQNKEARILVRCEQSPFGKALISVEDSGPGIPGNSQRVFRVFRTTKDHGTGLGLLIARKIVEAHDGTIAVSQSHLLKGARFEIQIPLEPFQGASA